MDKYQFYALLISAISAIGSFTVAFIAVFGNWIKKLFIKPIIKININSNKPYVETLLENNPSESTSFKYKKIHLKINNLGKISALNSQLLIESIFKKREENQTYFKYKSFIPNHFYWENENKSKPISTSISHFIEIARIQKYSEYSNADENISNSKNKEEFRLWLTIENKSLKGTYYFLGKGTFILPIIFYSDSLSNSKKIFIEIFWNCDQIDSMNDSNFYVKLIDNKNLPNEIKNEI